MNHASWPHRLRIFSSDPAITGGSQDDDGVWTPNPLTPSSVDLYNDMADVQDGGAMFNRSTYGDFVEGSDAVAFLKNERAITQMYGKTGMLAEITWEDGTTSMATVTKVRRLDGTVWMKHV